MLPGSSPVALAERSETVLRGLSTELSARTAPETHAGALELATGVHSDVGSAVAELASLRAQLAHELAAMGLLAASSGTYPLAHPGEFRVSTGARYGAIGESMRGLARREPTFALHLHIGVPDPEDAIRLLNGLREAVPILIALSANSPFTQGRDSGFASVRTVIFQGFPRTGTARSFENYADYVETVDALIASGALPDPTFLWWDVRLQPALGTVELRMMDAQTTIADSAVLIGSSCRWREPSSTATTRRGHRRFASVPRCWRRIGSPGSQPRWARIGNEPGPGPAGRTAWSRDWLSALPHPEQPGTEPPPHSVPRVESA